MAASLMWINSPAYTGPLSSRAGGSDLSVFTGMAAGGLAYWLLARRTVPAEEGLPVPIPTVTGVAVTGAAVPEAE